MMIYSPLLFHLII